MLIPLSFLITKPIKLNLLNLNYGPHHEPHYRTQGCVIRENNITAPITNPIKDTLVLLRTSFNANGFVRWCTSVYLNLFHWAMGKNFGNRNGVCRYVRATYLECSFFLIDSMKNKRQHKNGLLTQILVMSPSRAGSSHSSS